MRKQFKVDGPFDLAASLESGQAFRWERYDGGYTGVAAGHLFFLWFSNGVLTVESPSCADPEGFVRWYFDMDTDYIQLCSRLERTDSTVAQAVQFAPGLRLLRQEPWEVFVSFLLSQNNNIPRIKQLVSRLCYRWGKVRSEGGHSWHVFPEPHELARATEAELRACGVGYRASFIREAAQKVSSGEFVLDELATLPTAPARNRLLSLRGVGRKVADCILLFGFRKLDAFPIDVWVKRGLEKLYFEGKEQRLEHLRSFTQSYFVSDAGYAQNYLFYYIRQRGRAGPRQES